MRWRYRFFLPLLLLFFVAAPASAQYMFLDTNGDGAHTSADVLVSGANAVNVYLDTNHNRDGSVATCDAGGEPLTLGAYYVNLSGTNVTYSLLTNQMGAAFATHFGSRNVGDGTLQDGYGSQGALAEGLYKLASLTITTTGAGASVNIVDVIPSSPVTDFTNFGTGPGGCFGNDFDNTYKLNQGGGGTDWTDVDGLTMGGPVNQAPVLDAIGNKTVNEGTQLLFAATATDPDAGQTLTFSLDAGNPAGSSITSTGTFTWTPTEAQGPGTYPITVRVTDNGTPALNDFETINVTVNEVNQAPVLAAIGDKTVNQGGTLSFTATATDADIPTQSLTFSLGAGAPAGATINATTGAFSWTPSTGGSFPITVIVTDNGPGNLSDSELITVTVQAVNSAPTLAAIGNKTVNEGSLLSFTATATDPDAGQTLTFTLDAGAPTGAAITAGGAFTWTPTEAQGPGTYPITIRVSDGSLDDFETINVTVNEVNVAPVLDPIGNKSGAVGTPVTFTATATDADIPANTLTFSLGAGAPAGATINATTGAFSWTPSTSGSFSVTVIVTDNGTPNLTDTETITIDVSATNAAPTLAAIGNKTVDEGTLLTFTATATDPDLDALTFTLDAGAPTGAAITAGGVFTWTPTEAQGPGTYPITIRVSDGSLDDFETINVTVNEVNVAPVLNPIGNQSGAVGTPVTFTATATDADIPANTLTFSLGAGAPAGATINPTTGAFSWTPSSSGSFSVTVIVTDNGSPNLTDTETITIDVSATDAPPVLAAIGNQTVDEGSLLSFTATATDADNDPLTFTLDAGAPAGAAITAGGAFTWTPTEAQGPGVYPITVRVSDGTLSDTETINVTVNEVNQDPVLAPIGDKTIDELTAYDPALFTATATDADLPANTLTFSLGAGAPAGAAITAGGAFTWTATEAQGPGVYPITILVSDGMGSDSETINITVNERNDAPVLANIPTQSGSVGNAITFTAIATDSDIPTNDLTFSLDAGAPAGATIDPTTGAFSWTPSSQGTFTVTVRVTDNGTPQLDDFQVVTLNVGVVNVAPVLDQPSDMTVNEGQTQTQQLTASDSNGDPLTYSLSNGPSFVTVSASGLVTVSPGFADAGTYPVLVSVSDGSLSDSKTFQVTVINVNQPPTADAGGPYTGTLNVAVSFDGSGSSDPDGDALTYAWDFGDGNTGSGVSPMHAYTSTGTFTVTLTVDDGNGGTSTDTATVTIADFFQANAFFVGGNKTTRLAAGKPTTCVQIESVGDSFQISDVDLSSITMNYAGSSISAIDSKTSVDGDKNHNGAQDIEACFSKDDLRVLFASLGGGAHDVTVTIEGNLTTGGRFVATVTMHVVGTKSGAVTAMAYPNPLNPETTLEFRTTQDGPVKVTVYDIQGRLVKTLQDGNLPAGYNSVRWNGTTSTGNHVSSGVYYFKVSAVEGETVVRVTVLK